MNAEKWFKEILRGDHAGPIVLNEKFNQVVNKIDSINKELKRIWEAIDSIGGVEVISKIIEEKKESEAIQIDSNVAKPVQFETIEEARSFADSLGVQYHHKSGIEKITELIVEKLGE